MNHRVELSSLACVVAVTVGGLALAVDPADSRINPQNGDIEIADPVWSGASQDISYVINSKVESRCSVVTVTDSALDDNRPRLALAPSGDAWVTWWRDGATDQVLVRKRHFADGTWDAERLLSGSGENSRGPRIVYDGSDPWVAWEFDGQGSTSIAVSITVDEPDPIAVRTVVATTTWGGPHDVTIHAEEGRLWITWVHSGSDVGWVEYDYAEETWSLAEHESYAADGIAQARGRIRSAVLAD